MGLFYLIGIYGDLFVICKRNTTTTNNNNNNNNNKVKKTRSSGFRRET